MITNAFIDGLHANLSSLTRIYRPDSLLKAYESALDQYNAIQRRRESFPQRMVPFTKNNSFREQSQQQSYFMHKKPFSFLPYLNIKTQIGNLKFLVDTGSNKNYISPEHIHPTMKINCVPHLIKNISGSHNIDKFSELNIFFNYKSLPRQKFLLFRFHKFFDGLIGYESLKSLGAIIDTVSNELLIGSLRIPMNRKTFNGTETNFQINNIHGGKTLISNKTQNSYTDHNVQIDPSIINTKNVSLFNPSSNPVILETDLHNKMYSSNRTNLQNKQEHNYRKERINRTVQTGINQNHTEIIENFTYTKSRTQQPSHKLDKNNGSDGTVERFRSTSNEISRCYRHKFGKLTTNEMFLKSSILHNNTILSPPDFKRLEAPYDIKDSEEKSFNLAKLF
ncbi:uncharacterized protein LOC129764949 [Toxorhynchites rutilus septentrionalis]|uniref:uncharacterized protein LOC129764949 n=1 Tax=Toxorhynchites rutilus septentrionalis TaxID=329112 RepID=UPI00247B144D|nr:uncharacterized protein LOC129764949 [Toxorhynchites rutilus septentrionalis]XP_055620608.1 uncharacterized protein LOC129764949 [Toxorhynchites rutilus septentrionalis]XP_055620609.1 uncharacterized protein LOC129764949 [Toxorhynchites rutilus septentrionalis]